MSKILIDEATVKLVLEALENSVDLVSQEARNAEELYGKYPTRLARIQGLVAFEVAHEKAITALKALASEAKEQTAPVAKPHEQEPVAWMYPSDYEKCLTSEHVAEVTSIECTSLRTGEKTTIPLYTSLQRTWVGLTDEEIEQSCVPLGAAMLSFTEVARAIEAKLRSKNEDRN